MYKNLFVISIVIGLTELNLIFFKVYLNKLIPPIEIDKEKITRWHPEFDVESVPDIIPSPLPKIQIDKPKVATAKDILGEIFLKILQSYRIVVALWCSPHNS